MSGKNKKNTYILNLHPMADLSLFSQCDSTPVAVIKINGRQINPQGGFTEAIRFPTEPVQIMLSEHATLAPVMGEIASTVIESLDKETHMPIVQLYPQSLMVIQGSENDFMQRRCDYRKSFQMCIRRFINRGISLSYLQGN